MGRGARIRAPLLLSLSHNPPCSIWTVQGGMGSLNSKTKCNTSVRCCHGIHTAQHHRPPQDCRPTCPRRLAPANRCSFGSRVIDGCTGAEAQPSPRRAASPPATPSSLPDAPPACGLPYTPHRPTPAPHLRAAADGLGSRRSRWPPSSPCGAPFPSLHPHHYAPLYRNAQVFPLLQPGASPVDLLTPARSLQVDDGASMMTGSGARCSLPATLQAAAGLHEWSHWRLISSNRPSIPGSLRL